MKFLRYLRSCVYDPAVYHDVPQWTSGRIIFHAAVLVVMMAAAITISLSPKMYQLTDSLVSLAQTGYPEDLQLTLKEGVLTSNLSKPLVILDEHKRPFVTIDTSVEFSGINQFREYGTQGLVTKDVIVMSDPNSKLQIIPLSRFNDLVVNKGNVISMIGGMRDALPYLSMLIFIGLSVFGGVFAVLYFALVGAIVKLMALLLDKEHVTWQHARRMCVLAATLPTILSAIIIASGSDIIPFLDTFLIFIIAGINIHAFHKQPTQPSLPIQNPPDSVS